MAVKENVLTKTDDFILWFLPKIEKFPRNYKFLFGESAGRRVVHQTPSSLPRNNSLTILR